MSNRTSILLSPNALPTPPASISSSDCSAPDSTDDATSPKRIRFAPLPVPERAVPSSSTPVCSVSPPPVPPPIITTPSSPKRSKRRPPDQSKLTFRSKSWFPPFFKGTSRSTPSSITSSPLSSDIDEKTPISGSSTDTEQWGVPLNRWASPASFSSTNRKINGSPLSRTQSSQSHKKKGRKGTNLLNGRVYGARHTASTGPNWFETVPDYPEPEFVEWGYGGMGSIRGGGGGVWSKVQSGAKGVIVGNIDGVGVTRRPGSEDDDDDDDDGTGTAWLRKRREQKLREQREREQKERPGAETPAVVNDSPAVPEVDSTTADKRKEQPVAHDVFAVTVLPKHLHHAHRLPSRGDSPYASTAGSRASSRLGSERAPQVPSAADFNGTIEGDTVRGEDDEDDEVDDAESDSGSGSGTGHRGSDEEEEDIDVENETRKTALGAGVEKISRHQDK